MGECTGGGRSAPQPAEPWGEAWPTAPDAVPQGRCQFVLGPPRHFLYPALLLLLAEQPRHGYLLVEGLGGLGMGRFDRPSVYRALGDLEADGLVTTWEEAPTAGSTRHVHAVTAAGEQALEAWMSIVAQERNSLDLALQRYWYCNARRLAADAAPPGPPAGACPKRFAVKSDRSSLVVEARSNVGPIAFSSTGLAGFIDVELRDGVVARGTAPSACLEVQVSDLTSGNAIYDGELLRRVDARRYPLVSVALRSLHHLGDGNCYQVQGEVTIHGVTQLVGGVVTATVHERRRRSLGGQEQLDRRMIVAGEEVIDIRLFDMAVPAMPLFKIYPEVRLRLHLEADEAA